MAQATPEERLKELDIELEPPAPAIANYLTVVRSGHLLFLSGHVPRRPNGEVVTGKLGADMDVDAGYAAARLTAISLVGTLKAALGELSRVSRIVRVAGYVNATPDFTRHPSVINGCSDLMVEVFGDRGRHARVAAGMASLPLGAAVEIEMTVEITD